MGIKKAKMGGMGAGRGRGWDGSCMGWWAWENHELWCIKVGRGAGSRGTAIIVQKSGNGGRGGRQGQGNGMGHARGEGHGKTMKYSV
jgi:hypothetical protein